MQALIQHNKEYNGLEVKFPYCPPEEQRIFLKESGFKYSGAQKIWYNRYTPQLEAKVKQELDKEHVKAEASKDSDIVEIEPYNARLLSGEHKGEEVKVMGVHRLFTGKKVVLTEEGKQLIDHNKLEAVIQEANPATNAQLLTEIHEAGLVHVKLQAEAKESRDYSKVEESEKRLDKLLTKHYNNPDLTAEVNKALEKHKEHFKVCRASTETLADGSKLTVGYNYWGQTVCTDADFQKPVKFIPTPRTPNNIAEIKEESEQDGIVKIIGYKPDYKITYTGKIEDVGVKWTEYQLLNPNKTIKTNKKQTARFKRIFAQSKYLDRLPKTTKQEVNEE